MIDRYVERSASGPRHRRPPCARRAGTMRLVEQPFRADRGRASRARRSRPHRADPRSRATSAAADASSRPGERLVEQHEARTVDQRALERHALPHAAREARNRIVRAVAEPRARERRIGGRLRVRPRRRDRQRTRGSRARSAQDRGRGRGPGCRSWPAAPRLLRSPCGCRTECRRRSLAAASRGPRSSSTCPRRWGRAGRESTPCVSERKFSRARGGGRNDARRLRPSAR